MKQEIKAFFNQELQIAIDAVNHFLTVDLKQKDGEAISIINDNSVDGKGYLFIVFYKYRAA